MNIAIFRFEVSGPESEILHIIVDDSLTLEIITIIILVKK